MGKHGSARQSQAVTSWHVVVVDDDDDDDDDDALLYHSSLTRISYMNIIECIWMNNFQSKCRVVAHYGPSRSSSCNC